MSQITITIKDESKVSEFIQLMANNLENRLKEAFNDVKLHQAGKLELQSFDELLNELSD